MDATKQLTQDHATVTLSKQYRKEMFVEARRLFSKDRLEELGEQMETRKESLLAVASS